MLTVICWLVFGPPMATVIASEFSSGVFEILLGEWQSFVIPALLAQTYLYIFGFYKTIIKFFDSKDSIFITSTGSLVFGFSWALMHVYQFQIVSTSFLSIAFLQGLLLAAVLYAFLNLSRDLAKYILYPRDTNMDARPVVIYGAGSSGNELFQSVLLECDFDLDEHFPDRLDLFVCYHRVWPVCDVAVYLDPVLDVSCMTKAAQNTMKDGLGGCGVR